jgi:O-antigen ligase
MRRAVANAARLGLLAGPTALAFFAGGYFDGPRIAAGLATWVIVAAAAIVCPRPVPRVPGARMALAGLGLLAAWTLASAAWAPIAGNAYHDAQRVALYAGFLLAAAALLRTRGAQRLVEPALAAGAMIVIGYGLSERMLPGLLQFTRSVSAQGRLEQPLTYWNAMGELAALGFVLVARLAGDGRRPRGLRAAAAAAAAPLGLGLYLSFSRGALFACAAGIVTLIVVAPQRRQAGAVARCLAAGAISALVAAPLTGVTSMSGSPGTREREGAIVLAALIAIALLAAAAQLRAADRESDDELALPRRAPAIAVAAIAAGLALAIAVGSKEGTTQPLSGGSDRLVSLQSNRYAYWRVALRVFARSPLDGVGSGGWAVYWLKWRPFAEGAQDAHSLELQTLAELGIVGLAMLAVFLAGIGLAARAAHRVAPAGSAGAIAGVVVYIAHSPLDWDWQMPALTLVALALAGLLLALPDRLSEPRPLDNPRMLVPRLAIAAAAVVICAWFAVSAVQTHDENAAIALIDRPGTPSTALTARILHLLDGAATLNPDRTVALYRAQALTRAGNSAAALRAALAVTRAEPLNIDAWTVVALSARRIDPALTTLALREQSSLAPPVPAAS